MWVKSKANFATRAAFFDPLPSRWMRA